MLYDLSLFVLMISKEKWIVLTQVYQHDKIMTSKSFFSRQTTRPLHPPRAVPRAIAPQSPYSEFHRTWPQIIPPRDDHMLRKVEHDPKSSFADATPHYSTPHHTTPYYTTLHCTTLHYTRLHHIMAMEHALWLQNMFYGHRTCSIAIEHALWP